ncbi:MAG TPA: glycine cleavage T C-terminal barrel domain-containing protein [Vicinamibacterales bacterium]|jgi:folate-binding protein YgfZ
METGDAYRAARETAAVFDRSARGKIAVAGNDRRTYLHAMLTNDVATLQAGGGCYAAYLTPQGRMMADVRLLELGDLILMDLEPSVTGAILEKLDQFVFAEDVRLGNLTDSFGELSVVGPRAAHVVAVSLADGGGSGAATLGEAELRGWREFQNARATHGGEMVLVAASTEVGSPGFDLYIERPHVEALHRALIAAGATPGDAAVAETLRIEAGRPAFGIDLDAETIPLEAGIEGRAISFTKGCYPGQEVVIRVLHRGHGRVARRLVGLLVDGADLPARGDALRAGDRDAGRVTSACVSPLVGQPIALAYVHRDFIEPGTSVVIARGDQRLTARVATLPFVRQE